MEQIQVLSEKLEILIGRYRKLQEENATLKTNLSQSEASAEELRKQLSEKGSEIELMQEQLQIDEKEKDGMASKINSVISEIDKLIGDL